MNVTVKINGQERSAEVEPRVLLVDFIRTSDRGVILRRASRRAEEVLADE